MPRDPISMRAWKLLQEYRNMLEEFKISLFAPGNENTLPCFSPDVSKKNGRKSYTAVKCERVLRHALKCIISLLN